MYNDPGAANGYDHDERHRRYYRQDPYNDGSSEGIPLSNSKIDKIFFKNIVMI